MAVGFVLLHRALLDSDVFHDEWHLKLFIWCLCKAEWKSTKFKGHAISPGQFITGRNSAADELKVSPSRLYRGLKVLADRYECITSESNNQWTTVTVCNWKVYQPPFDQERTANEQPTTQRDDSVRSAADTMSGHILRSKEGKKERTEEGKNKDTSRHKAGGGDAAAVQAVVDAWNNIEGVSQAIKITDKRRTALNVRLAEPDWRSNWQAALERVGRSSFCRGSGDRRWVANLDWFIKPDTVTNLLEGKFDDASSKSNGKANGGSSLLDSLKRFDDSDSGGTP